MNPVQANEASDGAARRGEDIVVFSIRKPAKCSECGEELDRGQFLRVENEKPLCMTCADLDRLEYLPRGDTALTRRARKYSACFSTSQA